MLLEENATFFQTKLLADHPPHILDVDVMINVASCIHPEWILVDGLMLLLEAWICAKEQPDTLSQEIRRIPWRPIKQTNGDPPTLA
jgi:hypothetical protein